MNAFGAQRPALVVPPWFDGELTALARSYYEAAGFEVVLAAAAELPSDQRAITPDDLHAWVLAQVPDIADLVLIGGNGFRAVGVIAALEDTLARPVVTANQVLLWAMLRAAGDDPSRVTRYGRLFAQDGPPAT
ncbi:MAG TPA: hypothetical protein VMZ00_18175 [Sporichthya sp.]|nr:hypothetical protein [Sporichthya sp.]